MFSATRILTRKSTSVSAPSTVRSGGNWAIGTISNDGNRIVIANTTDSNGAVEYSGNGGTSFATASAGTPRPAYTDVAIDQSGVNVYLTTAGSYIHKSVNGGASYSLMSSTLNRRFIACDATGAKAVAAVMSDTLYTTTTSGSSWTARPIPGTTAGFNSWMSLAMSGNGNVIVAASPRGGAAKYINVSLDGGATWPTQLNFTTAAGSINSVAIDSTGSQMLLTFSTGQVFTSTNYGASWGPDNGLPNSGGWVKCAMSADGNTRAVCNTNGNVYVKRGGNAWQVQPGLPTKTWRHLHMSPNGSNMLAVAADAVCKF